MFLGDFAYPFDDLKIEGFPNDKKIVFNCEGYVSRDDFNDDFLDKSRGVSNNFLSLNKLPDRFILGLANNHVMDLPDGVNDSIKHAANSGLLCVGAGADFADASEPLIVNEGGFEIAIIAAGWDAIGCRPAGKKKQGVFPLRSKNILPLIKKQKRLGRKVALFFHWGYEMEFLPLPMHRVMAKKFVDAGADILVGAHAHCLQGFEVYKGVSIFYGLGNASFMENYFYDGKLSFPNFCKVGLAIEWDPVSGHICLGETELVGNLWRVKPYLSSATTALLEELSEFSGLNDRDYVQYFIANRRKKKLLPIFDCDDNGLKYWFLLKFVSFRASLIRMLFLMGLKGTSV